MTAPTPTPNTMPGAQPPNLNPQLQNPVSTGTPPAAPQPPAAPAAPEAPAAPQQKPDEPPVTGTPPPGSAVPDENWRDIARKNEARAKENADKAKAWDDYQATLRSKEEQQQIEIAQRDERIKQLETETRQEKIARETGVLPQFLGSGTEEEMRAAAKAALDWRGVGQPPPPPPPPQTAAVPASTVTSADKMGAAPNGVQQLTREQFVALPPAERMQAVRAGQCTNLGIGKPQEQRRMGNEVELGAHGGRQ